MSVATSTTVTKLPLPPATPCASIPAPEAEAAPGCDAHGERNVSNMSASKRQMHLGVFVLGTGNHSAGWRYEGAATSSCSLPVMLEIAKIAERGKFDLFFISDGRAMAPGDPPSFVNRFEPMTL